MKTENKLYQNNNWDIKNSKTLNNDLTKAAKHPQVMNVQKQKKSNAMCNELFRKTRPDF